MSNSQIERLKNFLIGDLGLEPHSFDIAGNGFGVTFTVEIDEEIQELPEELKPFEWSNHEAERAMDKGGTSKRSWNGTVFELALRDYINDLMAKDPETQALEAELPSVDTREKLAAYQERRKAIWGRICSDPQIEAWEHDLEAMY